MSWIFQNYISEKNPPLRQVFNLVQIHKTFSEIKISNNSNRSLLDGSTRKWSEWENSNLQQPYAFKTIDGTLPLKKKAERALNP